MLACRYVNEVVIGAPYTVTAETMDHFKIDVVVHGMTDVEPDFRTNKDPYLFPKEQVMYKITSFHNALFQTPPGRVTQTITLTHCTSLSLTQYILTHPWSTHGLTKNAFLRRSK